MNILHVNDTALLSKQHYAQNIRNFECGYVAQLSLEKRLYILNSWKIPYVSIIEICLRIVLRIKSRLYWGWKKRSVFSNRHVINPQYIPVMIIFIFVINFKICKFLVILRRVLHLLAVHPCLDFVFVIDLNKYLFKNLVPTLMNQLLIWNHF